jgi:hypothetical protein
MMTDEQLDGDSELALVAIKLYLRLRCLWLMMAYIPAAWAKLAAAYG